MWTETTEGRKLIQELSKEIIVNVAPEEMELFDELVDEYFQDPKPPDTSSDSKDDPLGFGIDEALVAATPAAAAVVQAILNYVTTDLFKVAREETAEAVRGKMKTFFRTEQKEEEASEPLTKEQLEQIRKLARKQARKFGMSADRAEKMANALVGLLVLH